MRKRIEINPSQTSNYDKVLFNFLKSQYHAGIRVWKAKKNYVLSDGTTFTLTHQVVWTERKESKQGLRFQVVGEEIGRGSFGSVYRTEATIALGEIKGNHDSEAIKLKHRALKYQPLNNTMSLELLTNEYLLSSRAGHLAIKSPTIVKKSSYTAMKLIHGRELFEIISEDYDAHRELLSLAQRKKLTINLLLALKNQVIDKGIIHRDIKEENLLVDENTLEVFIIDYGLAKLATEKKVPVGTLSRLAPEIWYNDICCATSKSDIWAMSRILAFLWGDNPNKHFSCGNIREGTEYEIWKNNAIKVNYSALYTGAIPNLDRVTCGKIVLILKAMSDINPKNRMSIDSAIEAFSDLFEINKKAKIIESQQQLKNTFIKIEAHLVLLENKCKLLAKESQRAVDPLEKKTLTEAEIKIRGAVEGLRNMKTAFFNADFDANTFGEQLAQFKKESRQLIVAVRQELALYRNSNYILAETLMVFACLIIFYPLAAVIHEKITGYGSFFGETSSTKTAVKLLVEIDGLKEETMAQPNNYL